MKKTLVVFGLILVLALLSMDTMAQCAMCRGSVESSMGNGRNNVGIGLNGGIVYLLVMPYLILSVIAYKWYTNSKKLQKERQMVMSHVNQSMGN
jgi:uncharacterized membrane protein